jgi:GNAT superfamily N-acetyltransferase
MPERSAKPKKLTIRPHHDSDRDGLVSLWEACGLTRPWNDPDRDIALFQGTATSEIFAGKIGGKVAASCCVGHDGHRGWIYYLSVLPKLRGNGYGTAILRHCEAWLAEQGVPKVQLIVRPENLDTQTFYARAGYEPNPCRLMQRWLVDNGAPGHERERPDGRIPVTITYLEMTERPPHPHLSPPQNLNCALLHVPRPSVRFYRYLYDAVGGPWLWFERRALDDGQLERIIHNERVEIHVLHVAGEPAGYAELDRRKGQDIELAYFGLMPDYIGRGLGRYLMTWAIDTAWNYAPDRVWVNTNTLDHPKALPLYQRCGFHPYKQEQVLFDDPRLNGLIPG